MLEMVLREARMHSAAKLVIGAFVQTLHACHEMGSWRADFSLESLHGRHAMN